MAEGSRSGRVRHRPFAWAGVALSFLTAAAGAAPSRPGYAVRPGELCGGYPKLPIGAMAGMCAGLVFGPPAEGLRPSRRTVHLPRNLLALPDGDMLVVDLGSWEPG